MAKCQVPECYNRRDKDKGRKSFFRIPDPAKGYRDLAQRWLSNIGSGRRVDGFVFSKNKLVCEDHFEATCFREDLQAQVLGYRPTRKKLKQGSVPTVFKSCQDGRRDPNTLWPSGHLLTAVVGRKNARRTRNPPKPTSNVAVPSAADSCLPSSSVGSPPFSSQEVVRQETPLALTRRVRQETPLALTTRRPAMSLPTVTKAHHQNDTPREQSTRQVLTPMVSATISQPDVLHLAPGNHFKVRLVEFADKEVQTDPVMIVPIKRYNCWQGNKVS